MNISEAISIAFLYPFAIAAIFTFLSALISTRSARRNAQEQNNLASKNAHEENDLAAKMKLAEFRHAWLNELRDSLSALQSPLPPTDKEIPDMHRLAAKIRLLMNREDQNYPKLDTLLVRF